MARLLRSPAVEWAARRGATAQWVWVRHVSAYSVSYTHLTLPTNKAV